MRLALAQINTTVGDIAGNAERVAEWIERARAERCDVVLFPELTLPGYPAEDLYLQPHFAGESASALARLARDVHGISALVGFAEPVPGADRGPSGRRDRASAHNSLALLREGRVEAVYRKRNLPSYGVFDEVRQFRPGNEPLVTGIGGDCGGATTSVGFTICEDCWIGAQAAREEVDGGAELILNASASPWYRGRGAEREAVFTDLARSLGRPIALCNLIGAQDGLVFEGQSFVVGADGSVLARAGQFTEELLICEVGSPQAPGSAAAGGPIAKSLPDRSEILAGLILGLRDYVDKNGFKGVVFGLSGGIDSALVAALAVEALGPERVTAIVMPSPHSSADTQTDAREIAANLGVRCIEMPIGEAMGAYEAILEAGAPGKPGDGSGLAAENVQARIRGNLVMAISNREGLLALSCGNKSEAAVGYSTLYGDMAGGLSPIKDVPKTLVYALVEEINSRAASPPIPESVISRAPSAELRPDQRDTDSLPPYEVLDRALEAHIERDLSRAEMIAEGIPAEACDRVIHLVRISEHKRHQSAPGIRITAKALDRDRRMPITNGYRPG